MPPAKLFLPSDTTYLSIFSGYRGALSRVGEDKPEMNWNAALKCCITSYMIHSHLYMKGCKL